MKISEVDNAIRDLQKEVELEESMLKMVINAWIALLVPAMISLVGMIWFKFNGDYCALALVALFFVQLFKPMRDMLQMPLFWSLE